MTLDEAKVGRTVVYTPFAGCSEEQKEKGIIKQKTSLFLFVQYGNDFFAKATKAEDLEYLEEGE